MNENTHRLIRRLSFHTGIRLDTEHLIALEWLHHNKGHNKELLCVTSQHGARSVLSQEVLRGTDRQTNKQTKYNRSKHKGTYTQTDVYMHTSNASKQTKQAKKPPKDRKWPKYKPTQLRLHLNTKYCSEELNNRLWYGYFVETKSHLFLKSCLGEKLSALIIASDQIRFVSRRHRRIWTGCCGNNFGMGTETYGCDAGLQRKSFASAHACLSRRAVRSASARFLKYDTLNP